MISDIAFKILLVAGARPNFVKIAPLFRVFASCEQYEPILIHTGQHYDEQMSGQFFVDLALPSPQHNLDVGSGSHAQQTAEIMKRFEPIVLAHRPGCVLVVGDVNSTVACALVAAKLGIPVVHVEAGLRSFDRSMPEEINRIVTDAISDLLLVSEATGLVNLRREGIPEERICLVGNLMIDSLFWHLRKAEQAALPHELGLDGKRFGLITLHRPANVDDPASLASILTALGSIAEQMPLYFAVHPRTRSKLQGLHLSDRIVLLDAPAYLDFLSLMIRSSVVLTDSGGIQEETTALGIPCLTLRENTERPITISEGTNRLAGTTCASILAAWEDFKQNPKQGTRPAYWDGDAASRCRDAIGRYFKVPQTSAS
jgi:UDP-N-acetylglucosamine 2-epimerase (non-hydrolysing)